MSDNKKYYYLKMKDNYFNADNIKIIEGMNNGYIYSLIILKLYFKSCKYEGKLMMTERIPYDPDKMDILAKVINHDIAHLKEAIKLGRELDIITILDSGAIWMNEIQAFIGHSSSEADRKRTYRKKLEQDKCPKDVPKVSVKRPLELKIERELKIKREKPTTELTEKINSLHNIIQLSFEAINGVFDNYAIEGNAIKSLIEKAKKTNPDNPELFIQNMLDAFKTLRETDTKNYWSNMPFLPSRLNSNGIWTNVKQIMQNKKNDIEEGDNLEKLCEGVF